jgi:hypothetical protein
MNPQESCQAAEAKIQEAQRLMLDPRPEAIERCLNELSQVIALMEKLTTGGSRDWTPEVHASFHRIKSAVDRLRLQIEHASNLCLGWLQVRFGAGYTRQGLPELAERDTKSSLDA